MASLSGVSGSSMTSSLYNSANIISGLASGMDTEGMIESLVQSYQAKIDQLSQKATKIEWKQDAYRSIISKMYSFSSKYASYTSYTNLMSPGFFSSAVKVAALGKYADAVSASGKTSSDISLNAVHQLATATQYRTSSNLISDNGTSIKATEAVDLEGKTILGKLNGGLTLSYGSQTVSIYFDQVADVEAMDEIRQKLGKGANEADVLAELINQKLSGQTISMAGGKTADATDRIKVSVSNGTISFSDKSSAKNAVFISGASGNVGKGLGIDKILNTAKTDKDKPTKFSVITDSLTHEVDNKEYLSGKSMNISLDGVSKSITLPKIVKGEEGDDKYYIADTEDADGKLLEYNAKNYTDALNSIVYAAFKGKVTVKNTATDGESLQLEFKMKNEGSNLVINTSVGKTLGIGQTATSYLNTNKTLGELLGGKLSGLTAAKDEDGKDLLDKKGNQMYTFEINGVKVGNYSKDSTLAELMNDINRSDAGVNVSYSQTTRNFLFTAKDTGEGGEIKLGEGLASAMFSTDHSQAKITDLLGESVLSSKFSFTIEGQSFEGEFTSNSGTMSDLVDKLNNEILKDKGYTASYSASTGLVIKKGDQEVDVEYGNDVLGRIVEKAEPERVVKDYSGAKLTDILGTSTKGKTFSFTIGDKEFSREFIGNAGTVDSLVTLLNGMFQKEEGYEGYKASYDPEHGLVIRDQDGKIADVTYGKDEKGGKDVLGEIVEALKPTLKDRSKERLADLAKDLADAEFSFTIGEGDNAETFTGKFTGKGTITDLVEKLNSESKLLKNSGYTASYDPNRGLVVTRKDEDGNDVEVEVHYGDDKLGDIVKAIEPEDRSKDTLVGILGGDTILPDSRTFNFKVDGKEYPPVEITSNEATMDDLLKTINKSLEGSGYKASFAAASGELVITDDKGREANVEYDSSLGRIIDKYDDTFEEGKESAYTKGQDAIFNVTVNGERIQMTRSSNSIEIDGLTINLNETFNTVVDDETGNPVLDADGRYQLESARDAVTFKSTTDSDKIIDVIKSMVEDYNVMMIEIKSAYSTMPYRNSSGAFANYEPLTDSDKEGMTESAIERYEEKAKQGILFGDRTLSMLYTKMNQAFSFSSTEDVDTLKDMGITVNYSTSSNLQVVSIDEDKLRSMLDSDPDRVADLFTKTDGIMDRMKTQLDNYAKTTGEPKGILVQQAGSPLSSLSLLNNTWQTQIDSISTQIEKWQDKLSDQVDRYTQQFSRMEQLINELNAQSSALASLMGGS